MTRNSAHLLIRCLMLTGYGKNRLASNSLLESLVFAKRAATQMTENMSFVKRNDAVFATIDADMYSDIEKLQREYQELVKEEIEKSKEKR